jgi:hypothetical protein
MTTLARAERDDAAILTSSVREANPSNGLYPSVETILLRNSSSELQRSVASETSYVSCARNESAARASLAHPHVTAMANAMAASLEGEAFIAQGRRRRR